MTQREIIAKIKRTLKTKSYTTIGNLLVISPREIRRWLKEEHQMTKNTRIRMSGAINAGLLD